MDVSCTLSYLTLLYSPELECTILCSDVGLWHREAKPGDRRKERGEKKREEREKKEMKTHEKVCMYLCIGSIFFCCPTLLVVSSIFR